jgi:integrase
MHRFNDLPWNPAHRDIQEPLQGVLRQHGRPVKKAAALTLDMLRQIVATCDRTARGRRDRALLLIGFAGALRRSELVALQVEDISRDASGLRLRIRRGKTDRAGEGACPAAGMSKPAPSGRSRRGKKWRSVAPARCSGASAPAAAFSIPPCTPMPSAASWHIAWAWLASRSMVLIG